MSMSSPVSFKIARLRNVTGARSMASGALSSDKRVLACNLAEATDRFSKGALAYVYNNNPGWAGERMEIYGRSRSGRWILQWVPIHRLTNFRFKTIPPEHPRYDKPALDRCAEVAAGLFQYEGMADRYTQQASTAREQYAAKRTKV